LSQVGQIATKYGVIKDIYAIIPAKDLLPGASTRESSDAYMWEADRRAVPTPERKFPGGRKKSSKRY